VTVSHGGEPQARAQLGGRRPPPRTATVNLARRPFANTRPIQRLGIFLWVVGGALALVAGFLYWRSLFGIESKKEELAGIERAMQEENRRLETAEAELRRMNLRRQNLEASYLNDRIAERTFPWSGLFGDLADVLPREVRLFSLAPAGGSANRRAAVPAASRGRPQGPRRVYLQMTGAAESDEALLALLDNLFASPSFDSPSLPRETREGSALRFSLNVFYLPDAPRRDRQPGPSLGDEATVEELAPHGAGGEGR
jgi:Tfp pilus assembly protein PilN